MGLNAGPVPARVDATVKAGLLELIDYATGGGWTVRRACEVIELHEDRAGRWRRRRDAGLSLDDATPGPDEPLHALLDWERDAIIELFDQWGQVDRSHRKLAHRGSRLGKVFVSESSVLRVLKAQDLVLPARPPRDPVAARPWPDWVTYRPCQVWGHDFLAFVRANRDALAVLDLVSRKWIATLLVVHQRGESKHVKAIYTIALEAEGCWLTPKPGWSTPTLTSCCHPAGRVRRRATDDLGHHPRVDGTARAGDARRSSRDPTDQAHIESLWGHVKTEWPHLEDIRDPAVLAAELEGVRIEYNTVRLSQGVGPVWQDVARTG